MLDLWLRKVFAAVVNVNRNVPEERVTMNLFKNGFLLLPEDSTDIYIKNMVRAYIIRRSKEVFNQLCYASFIKMYQLFSKLVKNDSELNERSSKVTNKVH